MYKNTYHTALFWFALLLWPSLLAAQPASNVQRVQLEDLFYLERNTIIDLSDSMFQVMSGYPKRHVAILGDYIFASNPEHPLTIFSAKSGKFVKKIPIDQYNKEQLPAIFLELTTANNLLLAFDTMNYQLFILNKDGELIRSIKNEHLAGAHEIHFQNNKYYVVYPQLHQEKYIMGVFDLKFKPIKFLAIQDAASYLAKVTPTNDTVVNLNPYKGGMLLTHSLFKQDIWLNPKDQEVPFSKIHPSIYGNKVKPDKEHLFSMNNEPTLLKSAFILKDRFLLKMYAVHEMDSPNLFAMYYELWDLEKDKGYAAETKLGKMVTSSNDDSAERPFVSQFGIIGPQFSKNETLYEMASSFMQVDTGSGPTFKASLELRSFRLKASLYKD